MELMALGLNSAPPPIRSSSSPEPEPVKKKKRSREEKEARREAKKLKKEKQAGKDIPEDQNKNLENGESPADPVTPAKKKAKKKNAEREDAQRKTDKAERKAQKEEPKSEPNGIESSPAVKGEPSSAKSKPKSKSKNQISSKMSVPPIEPLTQVKKRERSQTTPLVSLSQEGGPSTPKKPSILTARAVRSPATTPKIKRSSSQSKNGTPKRNSDDKIDDITLKARLTDQKAVEEYLANNWVSDIELRRLERVGVLQYKKGKLTEDEKVAIRQVLDTYKKVNKLSEDQLIDAVMATTTTFPIGGRDGWQSFWLELAAACPGRPGRYVLKMVQRMYDPRGHKGHFTPEEDAMLITAYELHPNQWGKIAEIVERTYHDCRDRYTKELQHRNTRLTGEWKEEEEKQLIECIKKMNRSLGRDEMEADGIPWALVVKEMGGTRTVVQCRKKWTDEIYPKFGWGWERGHERENDYKLVKRLQALEYPSEKHINWKDVQDDTLKHMTSHQVRQMYYRLKDKIPDANRLEFPDLVKQLKKAVASLKHLNRPKRPSRGQIPLSDNEDGNVDELEEEEQMSKAEIIDKKEVVDDQEDHADD